MNSIETRKGAIKLFFALAATTDPDTAAKKVLDTVCYDGDMELYHDMECDLKKALLKVKENTATARWQGGIEVNDSIFNALEDANRKKIETNPVLRIRDYINRIRELQKGMAVEIKYDEAPDGWLTPDQLAARNRAHEQVLNYKYPLPKFVSMTLDKSTPEHVALGTSAQKFFEVEVTL